MINITDKSKCCGCEACAQVCPKKCISMERDAEGFLYPKANIDICVECGLCEKVCPVINQNKPTTPKRVFAAINKDDDIRKQSSSGGVFSVLAEQVIAKGGVVFGTMFDENWQVEITYAETMDKVASFRGSKYIQAQVGDSFKRCKEFLNAGRDVLFCGTPCQISGLLKYLRKPYDNLTTMDFICHGVPSPGVWERYLEELVSASKCAIEANSIIGKIKNWYQYSFYLYQSRGSASITILSPKASNLFMRAFLSDLILRPSCYMCPAKEGKSHSDITIADFWGVQDIIPSMDDNKGTSLIILNTTKGETLIPSDKLQLNTTDIYAINYNPAYFRSAQVNPKRGEFFSAYQNSTNVHALFTKTLQPSLKQRIKHILAFYKICSHNAMIHTCTKNADYRLLDISFRDKKNSWKQYSLRLELVKKYGE